MGEKLFPDDEPMEAKVEKKEAASSLAQIKDLDSKIAAAIGKVKILKEEKVALESTIKKLEAKVKDLETRLAEKDRALSSMDTEKGAIKTQIMDLLEELESIEIG